MSKQQWKWFMIRDENKFCTADINYENPAKVLWKNFFYKIEKSAPSALRSRSVIKFKIFIFLNMVILYHRFCVHCLSLISDYKKLTVEFGKKGLP